MPWAYNATCACQQWINWTSSLTNPSNSTSPVTAILGSTLNNSYLPPLLLILTMALYVVLIIAYTESPGNSKLIGIAGLVVIIALLESVSGLIQTAVYSIIIFVIVFMVSLLFKSG